MTMTLQEIYDFCIGKAKLAAAEPGISQYGKGYAAALNYIAGELKPHIATCTCDDDTKPCPAHPPGSCICGKEEVKATPPIYDPLCPVKGHGR